MRYYVYRHIRLDKNEPFYIGIGTKTKIYNSFETEFKRAFSKLSRNKFWKRVVSKTSYEIEIIMEFKDYTLAKQKEVELIKLYGRRNFNKGSLVNLTDGGDGTSGFVYSEIQKQNIVKSLLERGNKYSKKQKLYQYDLSGKFIKEWESNSDAGRFYNANKSTFLKAIKLKSSYSYNSYWYKTFQGDFITPKIYHKKNKYGIQMLDKDSLQVLKDFNSVKDAFIFLNIKIQSGLLRRCCKNPNNSAYGYKWRYKCLE